MSTFNELVDDTLLYLLGFVGTQEQATYLTSSIDADDLTLSVADPAVLGRGIIEVDDELIWIDDTNIPGLAVVAPPYGRGYRSTTASAHATNTRVTAAPTLPRAVVKKAINQSIQSVYPSLVAASGTTFAFNPAVSTYALPAGAKGILSVSWESLGPSREWLPVRSWDIDPQADTTAFPTGATISLYDAIVPGRTVSVSYYGEPQTLSSASATFASTGLPSSAEDVIRLGAAYRMIPFLDMSHLPGQSAEADYSSNQRQGNPAMDLGRYFLQQYQIRLNEESQRQISLYPTRAHFTR